MQIISWGFCPMSIYIAFECNEGKQQKGYKKTLRN